MKIKNSRLTNLILLVDFAIIFVVVAAFAVTYDRKNTPDITVADFSEIGEVDRVTEPVSQPVAEPVTGTYVPAKEAAAAPEEKSAFTVTRFEAPVTMYTSTTVNVRSGAGTDYDRVGKLSWGSSTTVTGQTDNGWYEVLYDNVTAFISGDYMVSDMPGIPYLFVGDSRTVQLQMAVGNTDKAYIAEVGEGYSYFKNTVIPQIPEVAGPGTDLIINFGVNDLANAGKYIKLINSNIDAWTNAGINVYYSSVTPVGDSANVSNSQIENFNSRLQGELDPRITWIDSYSYLKQTGFSSADGLHYNKDTYKNLYSYYMAVLSNNW